MLNREELQVVGQIVDRVMADYAGSRRHRMEQKTIIAATFAAIWSQDYYGIVIPKVVEQNVRLELKMGR